MNNVDLCHIPKSPKIHRTLYYSVQGHSKSLNSAPIESQYMTSYGNLGPIAHRYWDTATYWPKIANVGYPSHLAPSLGVTPFELRFLKLVFQAADGEDLVILA